MSKKLHDTVKRLARLCMSDLFDVLGTMQAEIVATPAITKIALGAAIDAAHSDHCYDLDKLFGRIQDVSSVATYDDLKTKILAIDGAGGSLVSDILATAIDYQSLKDFILNDPAAMGLDVLASAEESATISGLLNEKVPEVRVPVTSMDRSTLFGIIDPTEYASIDQSNKDWIDGVFVAGVSANLTLGVKSSLETIFASSPTTLAPLLDAFERDGSRYEELTETGKNIRHRDVSIAILWNPAKWPTN